MKLKTLKLKVTSDQQEYDFTQFLTGSNTIYHTSSHFEKEGEEFYWHVLFTYEPKQDYTQPVKVLPEGFEKEIKEYTEQNPPKTLTIKAIVNDSSERLLKMKEIEDFGMFRNVGKKACEKDNEYLTGLLAIIQKYQKD